MKIAVLVASRNRPDLVDALAASLQSSMTLPYDLYVVECGTDHDKLSRHSTLWYADPQFRGKCWGHALALQAAKLSGQYDYYFVLMNDVVFEPGVDPARVLIEQMEREPRMAILSPASADGVYPGSKRTKRHGWRAVTTCDYLAFMMRASAELEVGFLGSHFQYCWGAIHELSYKLYSRGWFVAYSDEIEYQHLGGSTYGQANTKTISREEYQQRAKRYAFEYFRRHWGDNWDETFWQATRGHAIETNTFTEHKKLWSSGFSTSELRELGLETARAASPHAKSTRPEADERCVRVNLGCGADKRAGWINVDANPALKPDLVSSAERLGSFADGSVDVLEADHLFEHLTLDQAHAALKEWSRVLKLSGTLLLEMPDLEACVRILGKYKDDRGYDLGMIGIFGWPPLVESEGAAQIHKWGWTRETLIDALRQAGFERVEFEPITQTWRAAAKAGSLLRLRAIRSGAPTTTAAKSEFAWNDAHAVRVFAWPDWNDAGEVEFLLNAFGRHLSQDKSSCLCLRRDPATDPSEARCRALLARAHERTLGRETALDVILVEGPLSNDALQALAESIRCAIALPSSAAGARAVLYAAVGRKVVHRIDDFVRAIGGQCEAPTAAVYDKAVLDSVDWKVVEAIKELHPWYYPVVLGNLKVTPGVGSHVPAAALENSTACRTQILVDEVAHRVDLRGKSVLELASNCGYWSARYAERGAATVMGLEGRDTFLAQARLYWSTNRFLPEGRWSFVEGNIAVAADWARLREHGPFDVVLCAGILYHVANYRDVLRWAAELTREALIVDTRVDDADEALIREPGELYFNAIEATRDKTVPNRKALMECLRELGLSAEILPVGFPAGPGVDDVDNYASGRRITILARTAAVGSGAGAARTRGSAAS